MSVNFGSGDVAMANFDLKPQTTWAQGVPPREAEGWYVA